MSQRVLDLIILKITVFPGEEIGEFYSVLAIFIVFVFCFFVQRFSSHDSALHRWSSIYVLGIIGH